MNNEMFLSDYLLGTEDELQAIAELRAIEEIENDIKTESK